MNGNLNLSAISLPQIGQAISRFLHRYHIILFACIVLGGLSVTTFMLYRTVNTTQPSTQPASTNGFDTATIQQIKELHSASDASAPIKLPSGRTNPFQ